MTNWLRKFMTGRYGSDQFNLALIVLYFVVFVITSFIPVRYLSLIGLLPLGFAFYRMLSRDIARRQKENMAFLRVWSPIPRAVRQFNARRKDKEHRYFRCPDCHTLLRVPKGKGKLTIHCAKCGRSIERTT